MIELGHQREHLAHLKTVYTHRSAVLSQTLRRHLPPSVTFTEPGGGFFIWLRLPPEMAAAELRAKAEPHQVGFHPGIRFSSRAGLRNYIRLSFCYYDEAELVAGAKRLAEVIDAEAT